MRIISNFKDYYDFAQKHIAYDKPCDDAKSVTSDVRPWIRNTQRIEYKRGKFPFEGYLVDYQFCNGKTDLNMFSHFIGFCGKIYPFFSYTIGQDYLNPEDKGFLYEKDKVIKLMEDYTRIRNMRERKWGHNYNVRKVESIFALKDSSEFDYLFEQYKTPIFLATTLFGRYREFVVNPQLEKYEFFKIFNGHEAYQEIEMYLGNMCFPEPEQPVISDEMKAYTHGFKTKYAFRKEPKK